jgi:hypothetical protein
MSNIVTSNTDVPNTNVPNTNVPNTNVPNTKHVAFNKKKINGEIYYLSENGDWHNTHIIEPVLDTQQITKEDREMRRQECEQRNWGWRKHLCGSGHWRPAYCILIPAGASPGKPMNIVINGYPEMINCPLDYKPGDYFTFSDDDLPDLLVSKPRVSKQIIDFNE